MAFTIAEGGLDFPLPKVRRIAQRFEAPREESIGGAVEREMRKLGGRIRSRSFPPSSAPPSTS